MMTVTSSVFFSSVLSTNSLAASCFIGLINLYLSHLLIYSTSPMNMFLVHLEALGV